MAYKTREEWLMAFANAARPVFAAKAAIEIPQNIRVSIGFPSKGAKSKTIGECFYSSASADGAREIFLTPKIQESVQRLCGVLVHELVHAALPEGVGHRLPFAKAAGALGLVGPWTATTEGPDFHAWAQPIIDSLGEYPGAALEAGQRAVGGRKKQKNGHHKLACTCGFQVRLTDKHYAAMVNFDCPTECGGTLNKGE